MQSRDPNLMADPHEQALLGGAGIVQSGQSELLGLTPDGGFIRRVTLINGECEAKYATYLTCFLTATRNLPAQTPEEAAEILPCFARVSFGNGGTQSTQQLEVDFGNGACFSVPPGFLRVDALLEVTEPDSNESINAAAFIGYQAHPRRRSPQRTRALATLAPAASSPILPIPYFSDRVELISDVAATTYVFEQFRDAAGTILLATTAIPAGAPIPVPLVNESRFFRVTNSGGAPATIRAIFLLVV